MEFDITNIESTEDLAKAVVNKFFPQQMTGPEKAEYQLKLQEILKARESVIIETQKSIIVAEMRQSDSYTKRARPTLVYAGLFFIFMVHIIFPMLAFCTKAQVPELVLPPEFWWAWSGVCGIWIIGRSAEQITTEKNTGATGQLINVITGKKK